MASETSWEPSPEAVEREAKVLAEEMFTPRRWDGLFDWDKDWSRRAAAHVLRERHEREAPLVEALRDAGTRLQYLGDVVSAPRAWDALRAHAALDAPPKDEPTLAEAVEAMLAHRMAATQELGGRYECREAFAGSDVDAVRAALSRERSAQGGGK